MSSTQSPPPPPNPETGASPIRPLNFASWPKRLGAWAVETLFVAAVLGLYMWVIYPYFDSSGSGDESMSFEEFVGLMFMAALVGLFLVGGAIVLFIRAIKRWSDSTNPVLSWAGMRVVNVKTGAPASMAQMLVREGLGKWGVSLAVYLAPGGFISDPETLMLVGCVFVLAYSLLGAIVLLATPARQGIWDLLARTTVVRRG